MIPVMMRFWMPPIDTGPCGDGLTKILLHFDDDDNSTTFFDEVTKTWTAISGATIDTAESKFGGSSLASNSSGGIQTDDDPCLEPLDKEWTIEFFVKFGSFSGDAALLTKRATTSSAPTLQITVGPTGNLAFYGSWDGTSTETFGTVGSAFNTGSWYHVAIEYKSPYYTLFIDGNNVIAYNSGGSPTLSDNSSPWTIGSDCDGSTPVRGWIDEFRYTLGSARYGGTLVSITVPSAAFTVD
jgi:hypothetical protein